MADVRNNPDSGYDLPIPVAIEYTPDMVVYSHHMDFKYGRTAPREAIAYLKEKGFVDPGVRDSMMSPSVVHFLSEKKLSEEELDQIESDLGEAHGWSGGHHFNHELKVFSDHWERLQQKTRGETVNKGSLKVYACTKNQVHAALGDIKHTVTQYNPQPYHSPDPDHVWESMWLEFEDRSYQEVENLLEAAGIQYG